MMNEFVDLMTRRRSIRKFKPKMIRLAELDQVLYAGLFAASGMGRQPCYFVAIRDPETLHLLSTMNARELGQPDTDPFYGAPVVVVVFADTTSPTYLYDGSLAIGNMMNAAHAVGLGSCWIHRAKEEFETATGKTLLREWGLPETVEGIGHLILGYPDDEEQPKAAPRKEDHVVFVMEKKEFPALIHFVNEKSILFDGSATTKEDAIREAGQLLVDQGCTGPGYIDSMLKREEDFSTYLGNGVAIAHGTVSGRRRIRKTGVALVRYPNGVPFGDDKATLVFAAAGVGDDHMDLVQQISVAALSEEAVRTLNEAKDLEEAKEAFRNLALYK
ncbi:MAG: PTS sugar transporter subunit IIA [Clostridia bacterium]|nr:PTS sugar transporter subunit IIA [Clostridia bacterium]